MRYQEELFRLVGERYGKKLPSSELFALLCRMGVVDHTLCKVLAIRRHVEQSVKGGTGKVAAMKLVSERMCVSFEYVRKCMYHYKNVNL